MNFSISALNMKYAEIDLCDKRLPDFGYTVAYNTLLLINLNCACNSFKLTSDSKHMYWLGCVVPLAYICIPFFLECLTPVLWLI
ncbi:hypothetical protein T01_1004 [Trichinella spiralis]|uniref:Uncharacterized protein n=1 Tax=Trichinella spiralis TaxID=6334 RepID=A0A0V1BS88_TRISP|nr:hypothetical protein T01_1004 [Trichinella spiralis]